MGLLPKPFSSYLAKRKERQALSFLKRNVSPTGRRFLSIFGASLDNLLAKEDRSIVRELVTRYSDLIEPSYDPYELQHLYETHWVVRMCVDKLVRESSRQGWTFQPHYEVKCESCGTEYDYHPLSGKCPVCAPPPKPTPSNATSIFGKAFSPLEEADSLSSQATSIASGIGNLSTPDASELDRAKEFMAHPNPDGLTFIDIIKRAIKDLLIFDDFYTSVALDKDKPGPYWQRLQIFPEDVRTIVLQSDVKGNLGGKTFCQSCESTKVPGTETFLYPKEDAGKRCPNCGQGNLVPMAYGQRKGSAVVAAWTIDEMMHGNLWAIGSKLFGTPKLWSITDQVIAMALIDKFQKDTFDKQQVPKNIYLIRGINNESLQGVLKQYEQAKLINPMASMWIPVPNSPTSGMNSIGIEKIPALDPPIIENSIPYMEFTFKNICYTFGVSPAAIGAETPGKLGTGQGGMEQKDVTPETINEIQKQAGETFDRFLKRFFPEIVDWNFILETAHEKETLDEWTVKKLQMDTAKIAVDAGFDVLIDEDGTPKISGSGKQPALPAPFSAGPPNMESAATAIKAIRKTIQETSKTVDGDIVKASRFQKIIQEGAKEYKVRLDDLSNRIFNSIQNVLQDVLGAKILKADGTEDNIVDIALRQALIKRLQDALDLDLTEAEKMADAMALILMKMGADAGALDVGATVNFDVADQAAIDAHRARTIEAMRNTLYFGDKTSYLSKIKDIIDQGIDEKWTTDKLAIQLQRTLDPEKEHFSKFMWERIARTESATYIIQGRLTAYEKFGIPKLRRIVTLDERTDPVNCAPFANAIYRIEDGYDVIPSHANCRCAFAPYLGDDEPLDSTEVIRNA